MLSEATLTVTYLTHCKSLTALGAFAFISVASAAINVSIGVQRALLYHALHGSRMPKVKWNQWVWLFHSSPWLSHKQRVKPSLLLTGSLPVTEASCQREEEVMGEEDEGLFSYRRLWNKSLKHRLILRIPTFPPDIHRLYLGIDSMNRCHVLYILAVMSVHNQPKTQSSKAGIHLGFLSYRVDNTFTWQPFSIGKWFLPGRTETQLEQHHWGLGLDMLAAPESVDRIDTSVKVTIEKVFFTDLWHIIYHIKGIKKGLNNVGKSPN